MYKPGHVGMSLIFLSPITFILNSINRPILSVITIITTIFLTTQPDIDLKLPVVKHRGLTHTIYFAILLGLIASFIFRKSHSLFLDQIVTNTSTMSITLLGFLVGFLAVISHLMADVITITGIQPFSFGFLGNYRPFSKFSKETRYQLQWTTAKSPLANLILVILGFTLTLLSFYPTIQEILT
jgi:inner membrane protein